MIEYPHSKGDHNMGYFTVQSKEDTEKGREKLRKFLNTPQPGIYISEETNRVAIIFSLIQILQGEKTSLASQIKKFFPFTAWRVESGLWLINLQALRDF